jgi:GNAT superfamily N-acetyltransferase
VGPSEIERATAFEQRFAKAQATDVIDLVWGYAVLQREFPLSHYHNRIVVTSAAPAADVLAAADEVLGGAGLRHRYVSVDDDALGQRVASSFVAARYEHEPIATMIYRGAEVMSPEFEVREVSLEELRPAIIRQWRVALADAPDDEIAQLADRTALYSLGAELTLPAVHDGHDIAAHAELYVDRTACVAQFENLVTHEGFGGRGYGTALVRDALRRAREAGCDLAFLTADRNDWPVEWYRRLGFVDAGQTHQFSRPG